MPQTKLQNVIFTIFMALVMVYAMICYNIALNIGGMQDKVFLMALSELRIMLPVAFILEFFVVERASKFLAFRFIDPSKVPPIATILSISSMIVCLMCPMMSFVATLLFKDYSESGFIGTWLQTTVMNFPMAFFWQIFFAGPFVRNVFGAVMKATSKKPSLNNI